MNNDVAERLLYERMKNADDDRLVASYDQLLGETTSGDGSSVAQQREVSLDDLENGVAFDGRRGEAGGHGESGGDAESGDGCCPCYGCPCSCHLSDDALRFTSEAERPIDSHVVYLFDYCLFDVPRNSSKFDVLVDYLHETRLYDRTYVLSMTSEQLRTGVETQLSRNELNPDTLRYKSSVIESLEDTKHDVRRKFRGVVVQSSPYNWFTLKAALNFPSIVIYVRLSCSRNDVQADHVIVVDPGNPHFVSSPGSYGFKIARILAHTRSKVFGIENFDFTSILETNNLRALNRVSRRRHGHESKTPSSAVEGDKRRSEAN